MPHQRRALRFLHRHKGRAGLFMAPGTMKTLTAIRYIGRRVPVLVICRRDDFMTWEQELTTEGITKIAFIESSKTDTGELSREILDDKSIDWIIITYDLTKNPILNTFIRALKWRAVITDESHMIKRWSARRTKSVVAATRHVPKRIALTGTPITNEPLDVFSQCLFIDNGKLFGNNEWRFRNTYYIRSGPGWYLRKGAKDKIHKKLRHIAFHVHEDDVLKLPEKRTLIKGCPMSGQQRKHYKKLLKDWELKLQDGTTIELDQVVARLAKLRQVAGGFFYDQDHKPHFLRCHKLKLLMEILTSKDILAHEPKVVIWASHRAEIERIALEAHNCGISRVMFQGGSFRTKDAARREFHDNPSTRLFIGQVDSGVGMNELIVAKHSIYYSNSTKVVSRQQSMRRIRRKGSEHHPSITYWDLVTEGTVDRHVLKSVQKKADLAQYILNKLKKNTPIRTLLT